MGVVARSVPAISDGEKLEREFNYDGGAVIWFEVKSGGNVFQRAGLVLAALPHHHQRRRARAPARSTGWRAWAT